ncbi:hypothetical protein BDC45DRAFT_433280 [Circinella umbellata]|nr:hypothetical protein BDC45DRAFT_433280 [Circinella umbellata]
MWVIYSSIIWVVYTLYCFVELRNSSQRDFEAMVLLVAPVIACPVGIYYIRQALRRIFGFLETRVETRLQTLRAEQKLKLDELKKKTAYYSTQSLIDRYDEEHRKKIRQQQPQPQQQQVSRNTGSSNKQGLAPSFQQQNSINKPPAINVPTSILPPPPPPPRQPQWYDRVLDAMVGDSGPESKFALICNHCFVHNGLVLPQEMDTIQYICPNCKKFNSSRKSRQLHPDGPVVPPSPVPSLTQGFMTNNKEEEYNNYQEGEENMKKEEDSVVKTEGEDDDDEDTNETIASRVRRRHLNDPKIEYSDDEE